jgi:hypothetical protein
MSFGKAGSTSYTTPQLTDEQRQQIKAQTDLLTQTIAPTYQGAVQRATALYNQISPGVNQAAQNLAGTASQAQQALGETGESALRTGISSLQNLFSPGYEQQQIQAALLPAQQQYMQNIAQQQAQFGASGNLGSARQALAERQLAGTAQAQQAASAAQVAGGIAGQRLQAGQTLAQLGQGGIGQALGAAGQQVTAAMTDQDLYNKYVGVLYGTPAASYTSDFRGTQGSTASKQGYDFGVKMPGF